MCFLFFDFVIPCVLPHIKKGKLMSYALAILVVALLTFNSNDDGTENDNYINNSEISEYPEVK